MLNWCLLVLHATGHQRCTFPLKARERAGPLPLLGDPGHKGMVEHLKSFAKSLPEQPRALVVVSPHWEVCF